jgi:hypothetical protein
VDPTVAPQERLLSIPLDKDDGACSGCHLVLAGVDINTIRAWLGHVSISTTNVYAEIDLTLKANAVALCEVGQPRPARSWKEDKDLMAFLKSL